MNIFANHFFSKWNGIELSNEEIIYIIDNTANFIAKNCSYSDDVKGISDIAVKVKREMLNGNIPVFDPTGTGMSLGDIYVAPGNHSQNAFGNFVGKDIEREFVFRLKEGLDNYTSTLSKLDNSNSTPHALVKGYKWASGLITDKYFAGIVEHAYKGIREWDSATRKNRVREALIESINEHGGMVNELNELKNPNISNSRLKEIAYKMGQDVSDILDGTL